MADQIDTNINITITIALEGIAYVQCDTAYNDCVQTVVQNMTARVHYLVTNTGATTDVLYGELWDSPGISGGSRISELFRTNFAPNVPTPMYVDIAMGTTPFNGSIRVGHEQ
jgi:hypothetical protein